MKYSLYSSLFLAMISTSAVAQDRTDRSMDHILAASEVRPLAALAAVRLHEGKTIYQYYGGFSRLSDQTASPIRKDTLFRIASISKIVTTIGLMELVEQGKINLDHDVSDYLGFPLRNPDFPEIPITVRMLLNHTSSIRDADVYVLPPDKPISSFFDETHKAGKSDYHFSYHDGHPPGTYFTYCNLCYGLVGTIIEKASGERFDQYQKRHVLAPLHIDGGYNINELDHPERLATLYRHLPEGYTPTVDSFPHKSTTNHALDTYKIGSNGSVFSPQGGLRISLQGLSQLARFMIQRGTVDGVRLLSEQSIAAMETPTWRFNGHNADCPYPVTAYGLSLFVLTGTKDPDGKTDSPYPAYQGGLKGHLGEAYGLHSGFWYDPQTGDAYLFAADGFPADEEIHPGQYSSFSRTEENIFQTLAGVKP